MGHVPLTAARPGSEEKDLGLSAQIRLSSRTAHIEVEEAFALDVRLADLDAYAHLLGVLHDFYAPTEDALNRLRGWEQLTPVIDVGARRRAGLIDTDMSRLAPRSLRRDPSSASAYQPESFAAGLGCLYVLEGSALGGRIVAHRARKALGRDVPVAFFSSAGRDHLGADWSALLAALDHFGAEQGEDACQSAIEAACETFRLLGMRLGARVPAK